MPDAPITETGEAAPLSTTLDVDAPNQPSGGGVPNLSEPAEPEDLRDILAAESKRLNDEAAKAEPEGDDAKEKEEDTKAKPDDKAKEAEAKEKGAKAEDKSDKGPAKRTPEGKFTKSDDAEGPGEHAAQPQQAQPKGRHAEPPSRFLPEATAKWANVPNEIKSEVYRVIDETERELADHRRFREDIREYEDLAKQHNVTIKDTMARYVAADRALAQNFGSGVVQLAQGYGHPPAQVIAQVIQAYGLTPAQYAEALTKNPNLAQAAPAQPRHQMPAPQTQQSQQINPQQIAESVERNLMAKMSAQSVVQQFQADHPDFEQRSAHIKEILDTGVLERLYGRGLTLEQKLAEAYRMAGGSSPSSVPPLTPSAHSETAPPVNPEAGKKSVRGAPSSGTDSIVSEPETDLHELLRKEARKLSA